MRSRASTRPRRLSGELYNAVDYGSNEDAYVLVCNWAMNLHSNVAHVVQFWNSGLIIP